MLHVVDSGEGAWEAVKIMSIMWNRGLNQKKTWNHEQKGGNPSPTIGHDLVEHAE